jgi:hypothetical protein
MSRSSRRTAAFTAIGLGPSIIVFTVLRNWHGWEAPPFWLDDVLTAILLTGAGILALDDQSSLKGRLLSAAFGLSIGVLWGSMFERLAGLHPLPEEWSAFPPVADLLTVVGLVAAFVGFFASLPSTRPAFIGTRHPEPEMKKGRR